MKRYDKSSREDREELEARLSALRTSPKKGRRRRRSRVISGVIGVLLVIGVLGAIYAVASGGGRGSGEAASGEPLRVEVIRGDTLSSVADKLEEAGVIESAFLFKLEARTEGYGEQIQTGRYTFREGEDTDEILRKLNRGEAAPTFALTIPEGLTLEETADVVAGDTGVSARQFESAARRTDYGYAFLDNPQANSTEGFLFPSKYELEEGTTASQIVNRLLGQYLLETESIDLADARQRLGLSEYELVTIASLIEKESASAEERPVIASVIYNRLERDMPLQIDATVQYALAEPKENLSLQDLEVASPYNTYQNEGLPPGPICSPSRQSLEAAVNPAETNYLYYVLKADGRDHFFTNDYDAFLRAKAEAGR